MLVSGSPVPPGMQNSGQRDMNRDNKEQWWLEEINSCSPTGRLWVCVNIAWHIFSQGRFCTSLIVSCKELWHRTAWEVVLPEVMFWIRELSWVKGWLLLWAEQIKLFVSLPQERKKKKSQQKNQKTCLVIRFHRAQGWGTGTPVYPFTQQSTW